MPQPHLLRIRLVGPRLVGPRLVRARLVWPRLMPPRLVRPRLVRPRLVRPRLVAIVAAVVLALPAVASAASPIDLAGTVTQDGQPAANVAVTAVMDGSDMIVAATTDPDGAFVVHLEGDVGGVVRIRATGPTVTFAPDEQGCVRSETATGRASVTIEAIPVPPVSVALDTVLVDRVCGATATPGPAITQPATDAARPGGGSPGPSTGALLAVVGLLGLIVAFAGLPARDRRR